MRNWLRRKVAQWLAPELRVMERELAAERIKAAFSDFAPFFPDYKVMRPAPLPPGYCRLKQKGVFKIVPINPSGTEPIPE